MVKKLAKSIRQYKKETVLAPVFVTLEVAMECILPLYMVYMLEKIQADNSIGNILTYGGILLALSFLALLFGLLSGKFAATASAGFARNLRQDLYYAVQDFSFANIDKFSTSGLVTRMTTDVSNVQMAFMMLVRVAFRSTPRSRGSSSRSCPFWAASSFSWCSRSTPSSTRCSKNTTR